MSNFSFRPAAKTSAKLLVGIFSESGRGKTYSALLLARGFVGPNGTIAMIETESGRGEIYVDVIPGGYQVCSIAGNFSPSEYGKAIDAAEKAKFGALIIDSASHEWESIGGVLDMAAENQASGKKGPLVWQKPKLEHAKHFVLRLMASPIPLVIVNMRAKYPMKEIVKDGKKEWARSEHLEPKQSEDILYEMLVHGWIDEQHRYHVTKYPKAIPELRHVVRDGEPLSIETGQRLAQWAAGGASAPAGQSSAPSASQPSGAPDVRAKIKQALELAGESLRAQFNAALSDYEVATVDELTDANAAKALRWLNRELDKQHATA